MLIRLAEEKIGDAITDKKVVCPCHLSIGQEAVATGVAAGLRKTDRVFGTHRSHSHFLAQGGPLYSLFAEILGRDTGCSKGMGGSMHLVDLANGFLGSVPIVAATIPLAVGAALASQKEGKGNVGVAYFGDGAAEEGVFHESMNFASLFKLPMLFVCENNLFSSHLHIDLRQPANSIARFADAHQIEKYVVDGNDVVAVKQATESLLARARGGGGPGFLECITYRWRGHVGPNEDTDVGVQRAVDLQEWKKRDPIQRLIRGLAQNNIFSEEESAKLLNEVHFQVDHEWNRAERAPFPEASANLSRVYAPAKVSP